MVWKVGLFRILRFLCRDLRFLTWHRSSVMFFLYENSHKKREHSFLKAKISFLLKNIVSCIVIILGHQIGIEWLSSGCPGQSECCVASSPRCWDASHSLVYKVLQHFKWQNSLSHVYTSILDSIPTLKTHTLITNVMVLSEWDEDSQRLKFKIFLMLKHHFRQRFYPLFLYIYMSY